MGVIIFYVYLLIGLVLAIYDWCTVQKHYYKEAVEKDCVESGALPIYWIVWIMLWPVILIMKLFEK